MPIGDKTSHYTEFGIFVIYFKAFENLPRLYFSINKYDSQREWRKKWNQAKSKSGFYCRRRKCSLIMMIGINLLLKIKEKL